MARLRPHVLLRRNAPPDSKLATIPEVTSECVNDLVGACMGLHFDPERPGELACLGNVHVCPSPLGSLDQLSRPLEIFSRLPLELTQDPIEHHANPFVLPVREHMSRPGRRRHPSTAQQKTTA